MKNFGERGDIIAEILSIGSSHCVDSEEPNCSNGYNHLTGEIFHCYIFISRFTFV